ncbi:Rhodanese-related sulfurtransferase [Aquimarina amphilecti]|uniref:Rhodanese-related sulfurtransferase n=1 Tax=Aquimarina amphilecti TaxID=1038014 RepID=A0A1H7RU87_AQUAM|nr:rhodanese-like domain-containing protein [Aquimarina amphilecti]SEL62987.1 Rhodanese-related sulfurtransferase [Aquimarina amphilecti]
MKTTILAFIFITSPFLVVSQDSLKELLDKYNNESIPYISVKELSTIYDKVILLDAREIVEYETSHLEGAIHVGYHHFDIDVISDQSISKESKIVVYCSLGIRSEDISEKLKKAGYNDISNLYGGIFEWKNENHKVINTKGEETNKVHAFSKQWGEWLHKGKKVYKK